LRIAAWREGRFGASEGYRLIVGQAHHERMPGRA